MDYIVCEICKLPFDRPRILPCGHFFCTECLQSIILNKSFMVSDDGIRCLFCPTCKQINEFDPRIGIKSFRIHAFVGLLVDLVHLQSAKTCSKCKVKRWKRLNFKVKGDESYDILGCCFRCQTLFCKYCKTEHDASNHSKLTVEELRRISFDTLKKPVNKNYDNVEGTLSNRNHFQNDASQNFEPTILSIGPQNLIAIANRRGQIRLLNKNLDVVKSFSLLNVQHQGMESNEFFSGCQNYGRISPCNNIAMWSIAFNDNDHVVYTVQHRCVDCITNNIVQLAFVQTIDCHPVGKCTLTITEILKKQLDLKSTFSVRPRNVLYLKNGLLLISDVGLHCIHIFDSHYNHVRSFGGLNAKTKFKLNEPRCLAKLFKSNSFAVVDCRKIKVFSVSDDMTVIFKLELMGSDKKFSPYQVACDVDDNFYVMEKYNKEVLVFNSSGKHFMNIVNPSIPIETCDILLSSGMRGVIFLYKFNIGKSRWHISNLDWSISKQINKNVNYCTHQRAISSQHTINHTTLCSII